ncbi:MAG TPA: ABC transporter ATP-binding protein [Thauera sp.]|uniref:metal ABC transporter ATP-binding protein n=1 Tax=Thauera sp. WB-2 TaxID=2897772 RepID=UPI0022DDC660|nr:ABC transporter ATP-binding protein [Thauera sp. WB-2]WBL63506.1 ABC transporter ATP-binding protein [Thauera sp. WB-2]HNS92833.1 ABC transporter ATP-binding protein [Thauera sp.]HRJ25587.1 ABC transporter ATP-binding protein [Thauera sp.]HRK11523.1 ABC transporter ATP-binding protein [Thauera sp.]
MDAARMPMIQLDNLTLGYDRHPAVHHLSGEIAAGALVAVVGPNGAGKSTLLKGIAGELRPIGGRIVMPALPAHGLAYMPQRGEIDHSFPVSVFDVVAMGLWHEVGAFGGLSRRQRERVRDALDAVGLTGFEARPIGSLSGGQLQRARFARLILQDAPLILLDEPFAAIDSRTVEDLVALILGWHAEGRTILTVVHDLEQVRRYFPTALLLSREPVAFGPTAQVLTPELLARARRLSEAFDDNAAECHIEAVPTLPPSTGDGAAAPGHVHVHDHDHAHGHGHRH